MASRAPIPAPALADVGTLALRFRLPIADLSRAASHAVALVPERWARRFHVVPLSATEQELLVATADPLNVDCERTLGFATGRQIRFAIAAADEIAVRIEEVYRGDAPAREQPDSLVEVQHLTAGQDAGETPRSSCRSAGRPTSCAAP